MKRSPQKERATAFHEAGHAVAAFRFGRKFRYVTIVPEDDAGGHVKGFKLSSTPEHMAPRKIPWERYPDWVDRKIMILLAGEAAQKKGAPRSFRKWHAGSDMRSVLSWFSATTCAGYEDYEAYCRERLACLFNDDITWGGLVAVVDALVEKKTLNYSAAYQIFREGEERTLKLLNGPIVILKKH